MTRMYPAALILILFLTGVRQTQAQQSQPQSPPQTQSQPQTQEGEITQTGVTVNYEVLQQGTYSGMRTPLQNVIKNQKDWEALWKKHVSMLIPQPPLPDVDFKVSVIAAIFTGEKNTSGYQIILKSVSAEGNDVVVHYRQTEPPANSLTLQVTTQPFLMLRIDRPAGVVQLIKD